MLHQRSGNVYPRRHAETQQLLGIYLPQWRGEVPHRLTPPALLKLRRVVDVEIIKIDASGNNGTWNGSLVFYRGVRQYDTS